MIEPTFDVKNLFLDRKAVTSAVDAGVKRSMIKSLSALRQRIIDQFQFGTQPSKPGQSPVVHSRNRYANLRNVLFSYDPSTQTGVVGSIRLPKSKSAVPGILEHGGTVTIPGRLLRNGRRTRPVTVKIAKRPAASVALQKADRNGELLVPFRNSVGGG
jgi:hypothetical protein